MADDEKAGQAFLAAMAEELDGLPPDVLQAICAAQNSPEVAAARAEVKRQVEAIRTQWQEEHGVAYPRDRNDLERLAARAGVPAEVLFSTWNKQTRWTIWNTIEGYLLHLKDVPPAAELLEEEILDYLRAKPVLSVLFKELWHRQNEAVSYDSLQDCWPDPKLESTIKKNLQRLEEEISSFDPTASKLYLDWSHAGRFANLVIKMQK